MANNTVKKTSETPVEGARYSLANVWHGVSFGMTAISCIDAAVREHSMLSALFGVLATLNAVAALTPSKSPKPKDSTPSAIGPE